MKKKELIFILAIIGIIIVLLMVQKNKNAGEEQVQTNNESAVANQEDQVTPDTEKIKEGDAEATEIQYEFMKKNSNAESIKEYEASQSEGNSKVKILNTRMKKEGDMTYVELELQNISGSQMEEQSMDVSVLDASENEVANFTIMTPIMKADGKTIVSVPFDGDYNQFATFKIK